MEKWKQKARTALHAIHHSSVPILNPVKTESSHGIILRTRPLTETSLIIHWLTPNLGRVATVAKGARRPKSAFAGKLDLFYEADFSFSRSRRSELHNLREVKLRQTHGAIREDICKLRQAAYGASFIEQATETETPLPSIYSLLAGWLQRLCHQTLPPTGIFALELKLLAELGLQPDLKSARLTTGARKISQLLAVADWVQVMQVKPTAAQTAELRQWLHEFLIIHLGKPPRGRSAATA
ncbi:MAG: DNA repair protein RecO [Verrucomicrobiota bacterium]